MLNCKQGVLIVFISIRRKRIKRKRGFSIKNGECNRYKSRDLSEDTVNKDTASNYCIPIDRSANKRMFHH